MAQLPQELLKLPRQALDILRYFDAAQIDNTDAYNIENGAQMSERSVRKGIRGLVTQGYFNHDGNYVYYLTEKGSKAIEDLRAYDAASDAEGDAQVVAQAYPETLYAVMPSAIAPQSDATLQLGFDDPIAVDGQLIIRLTTTSGTLSPHELTFELSAGQTPSPQHVVFAAPDQAGMVRIRIEAMQLLSLTDVHEAGGMFFDVQLAPQRGQLKAWQGQVVIQG